MTKVLIAVDDTESSLKAAQAAHRLFGDDAEYLVVNVVDSTMNSTVAWGYAYPVAMPMMDVPFIAPDPETQREIVEGAEHTAAHIAEAAHLPHPAAVGETGDVATAILAAAHHHEVDVIVVGSHERRWFARLLTGSIATTLVREADIPVLVVR